MRLLNRRALTRCALGLGILLLYAPTWTYEFINFDDPLYVTQSPEIQAGLRLSTLWWAWTGVHAKLWHPLTSLSHALDWQIYGDFAGGHHLTSVVLHAANAVLCFDLLFDVTGQMARSALVAALWAFHPLRVESVAWVTERKDVLCGFFWLLALAAYGRYATHPTSRRAIAVTLLGCAALLSKAMAVTVPATLLLFSIWPLARRGPWSRRLLEVTPLVIAAVPVTALTVAAQASGGAIVHLTQIPMPTRLANAVVSVARYLGSIAWPTALAVPYPYQTWSGPTVVAAGILLTAITATTILRRERQPHLLVGWLWFLGTLVPVSGLMQAGEQAMADRFTYMPAVGVSFAVVWLLADSTTRIPFVLRAGTAGALVLLCAGASVAQLRYWKNSEQLFTHTLAVTDDNYLAHLNLGEALAARGDTNGAAPHYREALRLHPDSALAHTNVGNLLARAGQTDDAKVHFERALALQPDLPEAHNSLGLLLAARGDATAALAHYQAAVVVRPSYPDAQTNFAAALRRLGRLDEARTHYLAALTLRPNWPDLHWGLGDILRQSGDPAAAAAHFETALRISPGWPPAAVALAWIRATDPRPELRDGAAAVALAEAVRARQTASDPQVLDVLAAAYAEAGRMPDAIATAAQSLERARATGDARAELIARRLDGYRAGRPYREEPLRR